MARQSRANLMKILRWLVLLVWQPCDGFAVQGAKWWTVNPVVPLPDGRLLEPLSHLTVTTTTATTTRRRRRVIPLTTTTTSSSTNLSASLTPLHGDVVRTVLGAVWAARVSRSGLTSQPPSLRLSGAWAAFAVATLSLACSLRSGTTLLLFYATSSRWTKLGTRRKQTLEEGYAVGGQRGAGQVLACSWMAVVIALLRRWGIGPDGPLAFLTTTTTTTTTMWGNRLTLAFVGFFACCAGDTWASELGVLSPSNPRLVTQPWKTVPPGTNGGVSLVGLVASAAGGLAMGVFHGLFLPLNPYYSWAIRGKEMVVLGVVGLMCGLGGSLLDSLLGATIQITYYDPVEKLILKKPREGSVKLGYSFLSNEMVNVVSTAATAFLAGALAGPILAMFGRLSF